MRASNARKRPPTVAARATHTENEPSATDSTKKDARV